MSFDWKTAAPFVLLPFVGSTLGSVFSKHNIPTWYKTLKKPSWCPPNWVFGPVWTTLYASMGYASYLVYRDGGGFDGSAKTALALYGIQLTLNWLWTPIFFNYHKLKLAFYEIILMWGSITATGLSFYQINSTAGFLFIPYQAWVTLASCLSYRIWQDNKTKND